MQPEEIVQRLKDQFPNAQLEWVRPENGDSSLYVAANSLPEVAQFCRDAHDLACDYLLNLSAMDGKEHIEVVYHLHSYKHGHTFELKVKVPRQGGEVPSLTPLYSAANFQEREVFDHFGVKFAGHPNLKRILLPDDWVGYPLLKDYKEQEEYRGMGTTRPPLL